MKKVLYIIIVSLVTNGLILAEEVKKPDEPKTIEAVTKPENIKNKDAVEIYEKYALKINPDPWLGGFIRNSDHKVFKFSGYGLDPEFKKELMSLPSSRAALNGYENEILIGQILYWPGYVGLIAGTVWLTTGLRFGQVITSLLPAIVVTGGGFVLSTVGLILIFNANKKVQEAVWQYNKDLISGATRISAVEEPHFNLAFGTQF